jgi:hypothetical protein
MNTLYRAMQAGRAVVALAAVGCCVVSGQWWCWPAAALMGHQFAAGLWGAVAGIGDGDAAERL